MFAVCLSVVDPLCMPELVGRIYKRVCQDQRMCVCVGVQAHVVIAGRRTGERSARAAVEKPASHLLPKVCTPCGFCAVSHPPDEFTLLEDHLVLLYLSVPGSSVKPFLNLD